MHNLSSFSGVTKLSPSCLPDTREAPGRSASLEGAPSTLEQAVSPATPTFSYTAVAALFKDTTEHWAATSFEFAIDVAAFSGQPCSSQAWQSRVKGSVVDAYKAGLREALGALEDAQQQPLKLKPRQLRLTCANPPGGGMEDPKCISATFSLEIQLVPGEDPAVAAERVLARIQGVGIDSYVWAVRSRLPDSALGWAPFSFTYKGKAQSFPAACMPWAGGGCGPSRRWLPKKANLPKVTAPLECKTGADCASLYGGDATCWSCHLPASGVVSRCMAQETCAGTPYSSCDASHVCQACTNKEVCCQCSKKKGKQVCTPLNSGNCDAADHGTCRAGVCQAQEECDLLGAYTCSDSDSRYPLCKCPAGSTCTLETGQCSQAQGDQLECVVGDSYTCGDAAPYCKCPEGLFCDLVELTCVGSSMPDTCATPNGECSTFDWDCSCFTSNFLEHGWCIGLSDSIAAPSVPARPLTGCSWRLQGCSDVTATLEWPLNADLDLYAGTPDGCAAKGDPSTGQAPCPGVAATENCQGVEGASCTETVRLAAGAGPLVLAVNVFDSKGQISMPYTLTVESGGEVHSYSGEILFDAISTGPSVLPSCTNAVGGLGCAAHFFYLTNDC